MSKVAFLMVSLFMGIQVYSNSSHVKKNDTCCKYAIFCTACSVFSCCSLFLYLTEAEKYRVKDNSENKVVPFPDASKTKMN